MKKHLLEVNHLHTEFRIEGRWVKAVEDVSFFLDEGEILGLVGESGSGKSVTCRTIMRLIPTPPGRVTSGEILLGDQDILKLPKKELLSIRGQQISMIFQEPMSSLNPVYTCGEQIIEALLVHQQMNRTQARQKAIEMLELVGIPEASIRIDSYPHELSGGMRQRVMIAMALSCNPRILIADEPTTALDPTIQAQILVLIKKLQKQLNMSVIYITHDLGVVAQICDRVAVMYGGMIMEIASVEDLFHNAKHPYTRALLKSIPKLTEDLERLYSIRGAVPSLVDKPQGCPFYPRCDEGCEACGKAVPAMQACGSNHFVRCVHYADTNSEER